SIAGRHRDGPAGRQRRGLREPGEAGGARPRQPLRHPRRRQDRRLRRHHRSRRVNPRGDGAIRPHESSFNYSEFAGTAKMQLLFPKNPLMRKLPEPTFEPEYEVAKSLGFESFLFNEEALSSGDIDSALKRLPPGAGRQLLYRGWILTEERYRQFHAALLERGY